MKAIITIDTLLFKRHFYLLKAVKIKVLGMSSQNYDMLPCYQLIGKKGLFAITKDNEKKRQSDNKTESCFSAT